MCQIATLCWMLCKELRNRQRLGIAQGLEQGRGDAVSAGGGNPHLGPRRSRCQTPSLSKLRRKEVTCPGSHSKLVTVLRTTVQVSRAVSRVLPKPSMRVPRPGGGLYFLSCLSPQPSSLRPRLGLCTQPGVCVCVFNGEVNQSIVLKMQFGSYSLSEQEGGGEQVKRR